MAESVARLTPQTKIFVAGHNGLVGSAIWRAFEKRGHTSLLGRSSKELDLRNPQQVEEFFAQNKPEWVVLAAAKVGGILANSTYPVEFLNDNLRIQLNVLESAHRHAVKRLLFMGSSCIYPKMAPQPIREEYLLTGHLEPTNDAYAIAKIAGIFEVQAYRRQFKDSFISVMPTNLYGPGDNFDLQHSHVLPALLRKMHEAHASNAATVQIWGSGTPMREFLHVDDLADACLFLLERYDDPMPINVGTGEVLSIRELAELIADVVGFKGSLAFDPSKPDGTPRKQLDVSRLSALGWKARIGLEHGIRETYRWYLEHMAQARR
jgi:GDP-L-fucose synthase